MKYCREPCFLGISSGCSKEKIKNYRSVKIGAPSSEKIRYFPSNYPKFSPILYTIESFFPFIETGQHRYWEIESIIFRTLISVLAPLALFMSGLFVGSVLGLFDKKL